jgi:hypothetical protein
VTQRQVVRPANAIARKHQSCQRSTAAFSSGMASLHSPSNEFMNQRESTIIQIRPKHFTTESTRIWRSQQTQAFLHVGGSSEVWYSVVRQKALKMHTACSSKTLSTRQHILKCYINCLTLSFITFTPSEQRFIYSQVISAIWFPVPHLRNITTISSQYSPSNEEGYIKCDVCNRRNYCCLSCTQLKAPSSYHDPLLTKSGCM